MSLLDGIQNWALRIGLSLVAALVCIDCSAQDAASASKASKVIWEPQQIGNMLGSQRPTAANELIGKLSIGGFTIVLDETKLDEVQGRFGGIVGKRGDAGNSDRWLCFHGNDASGAWMFWVTSGEVGGPTVSGFQWARLDDGEKPDGRCGPMPDGIQLPIALVPGMSEAEVRKLLGAPTAEKDQTLVYLHQHLVAGDKDAAQTDRGASQFTAQNSVTVVLRDGKAQAIDVEKTTTN